MYGPFLILWRKQIYCFLYWSCFLCTGRVPWTPENNYFCAFPGNCTIRHIFSMRRRFRNSYWKCFPIGSLLNSFLFLLFISWKNNETIKRTMDFAWLKQFLLFLATYLASTTIILLLTSTIDIVNNEMRGNICEKNTMNYSYNNIVDLFMQTIWFCCCRHKHLHDNVVLLCKLPR